MSETPRADFEVDGYHLASSGGDRVAAVLADYAKTLPDRSRFARLREWLRSRFSQRMPR